jgi:hypothetical protein
MFSRASTITTSHSSGDRSRLNTREAPTPPPAPATTTRVTDYTAACATAPSK